MRPLLCAILARFEKGSSSSCHRSRRRHSKLNFVLVFLHFFHRCKKCLLFFFQNCDNPIKFRYSKKESFFLPKIRKKERNPISTGFLYITWEINFWGLRQNSTQHLITRKRNTI